MFWGIIEELVTESSEPVELHAGSSSFSREIPRRRPLRNGMHSVAVTKEKGGSGMEGLLGLIACRCCRKFGCYITRN